MRIETRTPQRQAGGTLGGFLAGLIVGLGVAVVVAIVITKGSTPFTDKSGKLKLGEPTAGQVADPNKPMYGSKEAARQANKEIIDKHKPSDDPLGDAVAAMGAGPVVKPAPVAVPATPAAAPTPAATPTPAAAASAEPAVDDKVTYFLQAGAFRAMDDAENTRAKLALLGFEAAISEKANDSGVLYRVRIGPFAQAESMNKARSKLLDSGIDVAIVKNQK
ncbi:MAG TPA: SPOR domain-containing protein [Telluria sp.]|jgi:cell division protein FtsN